jgi:uncharacterized protein (TIGR03435 family)
MSDPRRISRQIYGAVIRMHPAEFRDEFGREMALDFEDAMRERGFAPLLGDACVSVARQWKARLRVEREAEPETAGHPFLAGQYCMIRQGSSLSAFDLVRASLTSMLLFLTVGFAANLPNRHAVGEPQSVQVTHGGAADVVTHATRATVDKAGRVRSNEWDPESAGNGSGNLHPTGPVRLGSPRLGFSLQRETPGGPPRGTLRELAWQLTLISVIVWLTAFFLYRSRGIGKRVALGAIGLLGIAASVAFASVPLPAIHAQILHASAPLPSFEVATVKLRDPKAGNMMAPAPGSQDVVRRFGTARTLVAQAYNVTAARTQRVVGGPSWIDDGDKDFYVIEGKISDDVYAQMQKMTPAERRDQSALMLQSLLADRFKLKVRFETRELPVYELVLAKGGSKLKENPNRAAGNAIMRNKGQGSELKGSALPINVIINFLMNGPEVGGRMIIDKTGLTGTYDLVFDWAPIRPSAGTPPDSIGPPPPDAIGPPLFEALEEQLGLKLVPAKDPVDVVVIDHIESPSEN